MLKPQSAKIATVAKIPKRDGALVAAKKKEDLATRKSVTVKARTSMAAVAATAQGDATLNATLTAAVTIELAATMEVKIEAILGVTEVMTLNANVCVPKTEAVMASNETVAAAVMASNEAVKAATALDALENALQNAVTLKKRVTPTRTKETRRVTAKKTSSVVQEARSVDPVARSVVPVARSVVPEAMTGERGQKNVPQARSAVLLEGG
jgi:hypothetical protein